MKKSLLIACCLFFASFAVQAQRYAIIDTKYILDRMPEYKQSQKQLDDIAAGWQKEIDALQQDLDKCIKTMKLSR